MYNIKKWNEFMNESNETSDSMKDLLKLALDEAFVKLEKQIPQTKKQTQYVDINDVSPLNIVKFMKENDIPDNAYFNLKQNEYDAFHGDIYLSYDIDVPTTEKDKLKFKKERFTGIAWSLVYNLLPKNGYKRVGFNTAILKEFKNLTVYDMYINNDYDKLQKYYSMFVKE